MLNKNITFQRYQPHCGYMYFKGIDKWICEYFIWDDDLKTFVKFDGSPLIERIQYERPETETKLVLSEEPTKKLLIQIQELNELNDFYSTEVSYYIHSY